MTPELTKKSIESELRKDGSLKTKNTLTKYYTPKQLYDFYYNVLEPKKCNICNNETKFLNFKNGYDKVCSRSCRKTLLSKEYIPDFNNIISTEELKIFLLNEFKECNVSNKLNYAFFINNNYIKELNTLLLYMKNINETKINIKLINDLIFGIGICLKCSKQTTFKGFGKGYSQTCSNNRCSKSLHIMEEINHEYVIKNFIKDGKFLIEDMMKYYNVSLSFVNKWKVKNSVNIENKHKKYSFGEKILFREFKNEYKVRTNCRDIINPYEIDIVIDEKLCIEYDGLLFHSKGLGFPGDCSKRFKDKLIPDKYQFLTIFENEFLDEIKRNIWLSIIKSKLTNKIELKEYYINVINNNTLADFLKYNDLEGYIDSDISIGLFNIRKELQQVLCVNIKNNKYIITRLCNLLNHNYEYNLILEYFNKEYKPKEIIMSLSKRWNSFSEYEKYGFKLLEQTNPNKFYFKVNENKLFKEKNKSEMEMLKDHRIIYDYGDIIIQKLEE